MMSFLFIGNRLLPTLTIVGAFALPAAALAGPPLDRAEINVRGGAVVPGEVIVRFANDATAEDRLDARRAAGVTFERPLRVSRAQLVETDGTVGSAVDRLERQPGVAYAQPNYRYQASPAPPHWQTYVENGGLEWGFSSEAADGLRSATDSPGGDYGQAIAPDDFAVSELFRSAAVDLGGQRGCRMHFATMYQVEPPDEDGSFYDVFAAGAVSGLPGDPVLGYAGESGGYPSAFDAEEISISSLDGRSDVQPVFSLLSDSSIELDGAYVDDLRIFCRDQTYVDGISPIAQYDEPNVGNYVRFNGTSMAAPHVAGVAALVGAAVPATSDTGVVGAIEGGGTPLASLIATTGSGCTVDAAGAIAVASGSAAGLCSGHPVVPPVAPPNDSFFGQLWGLESSSAPNPGVNALEGWSTTRGDGQVIAVVDTGVDLTHPDLQGNLWTGTGGIHGHDFVDDDSDPDDYNFHGTHVAGTAAAVDDNGLGVAGVAPNAEIMAVRALDGDGSGSSADIADGITWAVQNGADVVNLSLGGPAGAGDSLMSTAVDLANANDVVVVAAAGNDGHNNDVTPTTPCTLPQPNLICVAAVTQSGGLAGFSNYGTISVDVGAPGTSILSAKTDYGAPLLSEGFESPPVAPPAPAAPGPAAPGPAVTSPVVPARPAKPDLSGAKSRIRVSRTGRFAYRLRATSGLSGEARFRQRRQARAIRRLFSVRGDGRVTVRVKLSKRVMRALRRKRKLSFRVAATVRNGVGPSPVAMKRLTLLAPRR